MKRANFKTVVKAFSCWTIDKRRGNYSLPAGTLREYLIGLVEDLLDRNGLAIRTNGDIGEVLDGKIFIPFGTDEEIVEQSKRIATLVSEMI